ncbi:MAG: galactokinase [Candidatus Neomarinimicrobiota bacterium]
MIVSRTPFRITLGGGGTDLPSYYKDHGGFIFSFCLSKYMYVCINRPSADDLIRLKYSISESVESIDDLQHDIAKACLQRIGIDSKIEIASLSDIPAGSGLGSSSTYTVGLLNGLHSLNGNYKSLEFLADEACTIEMDILNKPMGKQDQYLAALGGFVVLEIDKDGTVKSKKINLEKSIMNELNRNLLIFYTGQQRKNNKILKEQDDSTKNNKKEVLNSLHYIKESGYKILDIIQSGNIDDLGLMFKDHWEMKKKLSSGVTNSAIDSIYNIALESGATGGKISGAGGGGFFTFYCNKEHKKLRDAMKAEGLKELEYSFDLDGSKIIANHR